MNKSVVDRLAGHYQGRWMQGYVRGKLGSDPVFNAVREHLADSPWPLLDIGCGVGLCAFYLREIGFKPPIQALDFDCKKIEAAEQIRQVAGYHDLSFQIADACAARDFQGNVILLDVLHYLPFGQQRQLLAQLATCVCPGGICLIRATPHDISWRFRLTKLEEWFLVTCGWMKSGAIHYLTSAEIIAPFALAGFSCETSSLWGNTPLNSHLYIFKKPV